MADTKISALTAVTNPESTDEFAVNQDGTSKKMTLAQVRGAGVFYAAEYGTPLTGAAIQAAIAACNSAGGGVVHIGSGTWALGSTGLTIPGSDIVLQGVGKNQTVLTYTGTGAAIANSDNTVTRYYWGLRDLGVNIDSATAATATCLEVENMSRGEVRNCAFHAWNETPYAFDAVRMKCDASKFTYFDSFYDCIFQSWAGIGLHITGYGQCNRHMFINCEFQADSTSTTAQAIVSDPTGDSQGGWVFINTTIENVHSSNPVIDLAGSGGTNGTRNNLFLKLSMENTSSAPHIGTYGYFNHILNYDSAGDPWVLDTRLGNRIEYGDSADKTAYVVGVQTGLTLQTKAGTPSDSDEEDPVSGQVILDTSADKLWLRSGTTWRAAPLDPVRAVTFVIDGGGSAITTGVKGDLEMPFTGTIEQVTTLADVSGSIVVDIWKDTYANYPPTDADSITASAPPTLSGAIKAQDATLTGWTTAVAEGDVLRYNVDSAATVTRVTISLLVRETA